ncbi:uncharacterized protein [Halyomorpha halys]|uniref:uncharacterized protein n=1 Tax=Halyomorpha halys TaxID=286706 RepID=UPI000D0C802B|nr:uncharacterized protein LOC112210886 [Halyomorpha halys]
MEKTKKVMTQEMPMCETKEILNKLKNLVKDSEPVSQVPQILIRSDGCRCAQKEQDPQSQYYCNLQTIRSVNKTPPQTFDIEQILETEKQLAKSSENKNSVCKKADIKDSLPKSEIKEDGKNVKNPKESKDKKSKEEEESETDEKKNIITVKKICRQSDEKPEMRALIKEGKLPPVNEEVCTKDPKTGTFTCYTVEPGGRVIKQITEPQPLPEERKVEPHPILPIPKPSTNYELRGSKMLVGCTCLKRNGMQHDCQRSQCQGRRECLKFPAPVCQPSGLAPPIIKISPITTAIEPDCGPKRKLQITKTEMEKRKVLLNYARAQYYQWPPSPRVPCKVHKKGVFYIRPLQRIADAQTDKELLDEYVKNVYLAEEQTNEVSATNQPAVKQESKIVGLKEEMISKGETDGIKDKTEETKPTNKVEETLKKIEKDLNM